MLWTILLVLLVLWLSGLVAQIGGGFIHLLLVIGLLVILFQVLLGRRIAL
jgi:hypothetical protein